MSVVCAEYSRESADAAVGVLVLLLVLAQSPACVGLLRELIHLLQVHNTQRHGVIQSGERFQDSLASVWEVPEHGTPALQQH